MSRAVIHWAASESPQRLCSLKSWARHNGRQEPRQHQTSCFISAEASIAWHSIFSMLSALNKKTCYYSRIQCMNKHKLQSAYHILQKSYWNQWDLNIKKFRTTVASWWVINCFLKNLPLLPSFWVCDSITIIECGFLNNSGSIKYIIYHCVFFPLVPLLLRSKK